MKELEITQTKIKQLLSSANFLKDVLQIVYPKEELIIQPASNQQLSIEAPDVQRLPFLVAANIWRVLKNENEIYYQSFIQGMKESEKRTNNQNIPRGFSKYEWLKAFVTIKDNLQEADTYFDQLSNDSAAVCISPFKLYFKVVQEGSGEALDNQTNVLLHYSIKAQDGSVLADTWMSGKPVQLSLSETIPGFAWGIKGMKKNEIREIFIHPSLAYGIYTTLDKGIYLKAHVQLVDIDDDQKDERFPDLAILDLKKDIPLNLDLDYHEEGQKVAFAEGYQVWQHYQKSKLYNLSQVLDWMNQFHAGADANISSKQSQDLINRLHWNIYSLK